MSEFLFVYGTLGRNAGHEMHEYLARHAEYAGEGRFNGRLYRVAEYPGAVPSSDPEDTIFGELYRVMNSAALFVPLDEYEGCGPNGTQPTLYVRKQQTVRRPDRTPVLAWIYLFNRPVENLPRITSGRFTL